MAFQRYNTTVLDTYKVAGAMYTELDSGIQTVIDALAVKAMWDNTVLIFVSDNGGPLDHCTNEPLRGGKHTFFEGGVRVMSFISGRSKNKQNQFIDPESATQERGY